MNIILVVVKLRAEVKCNLVWDHERQDRHSKWRHFPCCSCQKEGEERPGHQWFVFLLAVAVQSQAGLLSQQRCFLHSSKLTFFWIWSGVTAAFFSFFLELEKSRFNFAFKPFSSSKDSTPFYQQRLREWRYVAALRLCMGAPHSVMYVTSGKIKWHWKHP